MDSEINPSINVTTARGFALMLMRVERNLRRKAGVTQLALATAAGYHPTNITAWEKGRKKGLTIRRALDCLAALERLTSDVT